MLSFPNQQKKKKKHIGVIFSHAFIATLSDTAPLKLKVKWDCSVTSLAHLLGVFITLWDFLLEQTVCAPASLRGCLALQGGADICFACGGEASGAPSGFLPPVKVPQADACQHYHRR